MIHQYHTRLLVVHVRTAAVLRTRWHRKLAIDIRLGLLPPRYTVPPLGRRSHSPYQLKDIVERRGGARVVWCSQFSGSSVRVYVEKRPIFFNILASKKRRRKSLHSPLSIPPPSAAVLPSFYEYSYPEEPADTAVYQ